MFSIIPKEMRLNKLESRSIISNKTLYLRAKGLKIDSNYGKGGVADFTSRELDLLANSIDMANSAYVQSLKENQMPIDTPLDSEKPTESE